MIDTPKLSHIYSNIPFLHLTLQNIASSNVGMHTVLNMNQNTNILLLQEIWWDRIGLARSDDDPNGAAVLRTVANQAWDFYLPDAPGA